MQIPLNPDSIGGLLLSASFSNNRKVGLWVLLSAFQFSADNVRPSDEILQLQPAQPAWKLKEATVR